MPQWMRIRKLKPVLTVCLLLLTAAIPARSGNLNTWLDSLLTRHPDYLQAQNRYQKEKALFTIDKSLSWADLNLNYQQYDNDYTRDEITGSLEHSKVNEKDKRRQIELAKQLFPKDSDNVSSDIGRRLEVFRYREEAHLAYLTSAADVLEELADWYEADAMTAVTLSRLAILNEQNRLLEELNSAKGIDPEILLDNLKELGDRQKELAEYNQITAFCQSKYGNILPAMVSHLEAQFSASGEADTLGLADKLSVLAAARQRELDKINHRVSLNLALFYLPEINLSLSYNWRENRQDWDINDAGILKQMQRNQDEEFPEGKLEFALPLNFVGNAKGKYDLLKSYRNELRYREKALDLDWQEFLAGRKAGFQAAKLELQRTVRIRQLADANLDVQRQKFAALADSREEKPPLKLQLDKLKAEEAQIAETKARLVLCSESLLINLVKGM